MPEIYDLTSIPTFYHWSSSEAEVFYYESSWIILAILSIILIGFSLIFFIGRKKLLKNTPEYDELEINKKTKMLCIKYIIIDIVLLTIVVIGVVLLREQVKGRYYICDSYVGSLKPIIYIYPEYETEVEVKLGKYEKLTCTYPKYEGAWTVIARPNGNLTDIKTGRNLYALYWEGKDNKTLDMSEGFVVKGEDSIAFLEEKLEILGLNEREAEEFIIYWLPKLEKNKYNFIRFETMKEIEENMPLSIVPKPDNLIRVMMNFKGLSEAIKVEEQKLVTPSRNGYTVVEWGGTEF